MLTRLYSLSLGVSAVSLAFMVGVTVVDAVGRYLVGGAIRGGIDYISFALAFLVFAAYPAVTRDDEHISVGILLPLMPAWYGRLERIVTAVILVLATGGILYLTIRQANAFLRAGTTGQSVEVPLGYIVYGLAAFAALSVLFAAALLWNGMVSRQPKK